MLLKTMQEANDILKELTIESLDFEIFKSQLNSKLLFSNLSHSKMKYDKMLNIQVELLASLSNAYC